jgi:hypothetical protein
MNKIDNLLDGSIDMHVHCGPDPLFERRLDALQVARQAQEMGMRGIVLKSHSYPTAPLAYIINQIVPEISIFGSLCLEYETGGMNVFAVEASAGLGAKIVWMPTFSAANSRAEIARLVGVKLRGQGINIMEDGAFQELHNVLQEIKKRDLILATGHLSPEEIFTLVKEAKRIGLSKIIITHALTRKVLDKYLKLEDQKLLAQEGAFIEHCFFDLMPLGGGLPPEKMVEAIRLVGVEHCIMSTDVGQDYSPPAPEGMRMFIATMIRCGITEPEIELMVKVNPCHLLGLKL